ncbi:MAG: sialate O-acetylesterase [Verrucomicrobiota bacterium]|nr:sialate O-acetylesterase [Verrucomicrobiota bacterium]
MNPSLHPHRLPVFIAFWFLALVRLVTTLHADVAVPTDPAVFHLYLLIGQSNMAGPATIEALDQWTDPRILMLNTDNQWVLAKNPLHPDQSGGVGPGMDFARKMLESNPSISIGLIPCAVNGSSIETWRERNVNYIRAVSRYNSVKAQGVLKGILMHQGEANSIPKLSTNPTYINTLINTVIPPFRAEVGNPFLPFVAGQVGQFLKTESYPSFTWINQQIAQLPTKLIFTGYVSSTGLTDGGDSLHFDTASERELGIRYAAAMSKIQDRFMGFRKDATEVLPEIYYHDSFGYYYDKYDPWVYHFAIGWVYYAGNSGDYLWLWSPNLGWMTTTLEIGPEVYVFDGASWICICGD